MALLQDKIVLVNGGSQGIGAGIVQVAVREGATVAFTGRRAEVGEHRGGEWTRQHPAEIGDQETVQRSRARLLRARSRSTTRA